MLAIPGATIRFVVLANSQEEWTRTLRPRLSGSHSALYPQASTRRANSAASAALSTSIAAQTPSFPSCIANAPRGRVLSRGILARAGAARARLAGSVLDADPWADR